MPFTDEKKNKTKKKDRYCRAGAAKAQLNIIVSRLHESVGIAVPNITAGRTTLCWRQMFFLVLY